jgi:hypothetical protein
MWCLIVGLFGYVRQPQQHVGVARFGRAPTHQVLAAKFVQIVK